MEFLNFFNRTWNSFFWQQLLRPILGGQPLPCRGAARHAYTYGYDLSSLHPNAAEEKKVHTNASDEITHT